MWQKRWIGKAPSKWLWIVIGLFTVILFLDLTTNSTFLFTYLYTGPILLANARLHRKTAFIVVAIAVVFTLLHLYIPESPNAFFLKWATIVSRVLAATMLLILGFLSGRNRYYQDTLAQQRAKLETQEQLASLREDFVSTLAHDLKTPLLGGIETLKAFQQEKFGPVSPTQQQVLATMAHSHQTSLQLVETLLDVYRNDAEGLTLNLEPVNLLSLVKEVVSTLSELAASRRIQLIFSDGEPGHQQQPPWIDGDAFQLKRVVSNLLVNAINHSPRGSQIEIVLESQPAHQVVRILDAGSGVKADEFLHLFDRFYQGQSDRRVKGTGLGLYLSRQIVEAHGGTIWAENRKSAGALFGFKLPATTSTQNKNASKNSVG